MARETLRGASFDLSNIPIFPRDQPTRLRTPVPVIAPPLPGAIQKKLMVGRVDDPLEHEADRVAEQVMRMGRADQPCALCKRLWCTGANCNQTGRQASHHAHRDARLVRLPAARPRARRQRGVAMTLLARIIEALCGEFGRPPPSSSPDQPTRHHRRHHRLRSLPRCAPRAGVLPLPRPFGKPASWHGGVHERALAVQSEA
jgi:hypothetical protein